MSDPALRAKVVIPVKITSAMLISSNVPETDYLAYSPATTYGAGEAYRVIEGQEVYQSVQAANTGHLPSANPDWWTRVRKTNRWQPFDDYNSTQATMPLVLSYRIRPGQIVTAVGVLNASGGKVRIRVIDPVAGLVYDKSALLRARLLRSRWYDFFYTKRIKTADHVALDLPAYPNADVYIDIEVTSGDVSVGNIVLGQQVDVADGIELGARVGFKDYSGNEVNDFGVPTFIERDYARTASWQMTIPNYMVDTVLALFISRRAKPTLFIGYSPIKATVIWGVCTDCEVLISYKLKSVMSCDFLGNT